jgi:hypothetical protein
MDYSSSSPYYETPSFGKFLDVMVPRPITKLASDKTLVIAPTYNLRPDLLAFDLYKNAKLWWVFAMRNPNTLKDPLMDFVTGVTIYIPSKETLSYDLGI